MYLFIKLTYNAKSVFTPGVVCGLGQLEVANRDSLTSACHANPLARPFLL